MTRTFLTLVLALLLCIPSTAQSISRRGPGCWRTKTAQSVASARLSGARNSIKPHYRGQKKGLVILAEFADTKFNEGNDRQKFNDILNTPGYTSSEGFKGSVADYFRDQSGGLFELQFDVVGPFTTKHNYAYYGQNDEYDNDLHPDEMIVEMCRAADDVVNFADYDWDGNHIADEVFVVYAGKGEADNENSPNYIWPHMWTLREAGKTLILDKTIINVYACANELMADNHINGIGTFCHEFSHCLGFPDFYDISYSGLYGMGDLDLMASGVYANNGFCPVGFSAFEKMSCGWQEPIVLGNEDVIVDNIKPMSQQGDFYIMYNDANANEYYLIENRQRDGWDKYMPTKGLMISHVDFDQEVWDNNIPNTIVSENEARAQGYTCGNDHQRMTVFFATNNNNIPSFYPYLRNDSLTATSRPAATLYNQNSQDMKLMVGSILNIHKNSDGTMGFRYRAINPIITAVQSPVATHRSSNAIYSLDGRIVNPSTKPLHKGIYIVEGKKYVVQ